MGPSEFESEPQCKMNVNTIMKLALMLMPGPFKTYNLWPQEAKNVVHDEFLVYLFITFIRALFIYKVTLLIVYV
jgi:hypothetical protein